MPETKTLEHIENGIYDAIATFGPPRDSVNRSATFEQLEVDSLDLVELAQIIEEDYGVPIETGDFKDVVTVGDAVDVVLSRAAAGEAAG